MKLSDLKENTSYVMDNGEMKYLLMVRNGMVYLEGGEIWGADEFCTHAVSVYRAPSALILFVLGVGLILSMGVTLWPYIG